MKKIKHEKAKILLGAMNSIDDAYLNEALSYTPAGKKAKLLRLQGASVRAISSVAAVAAVAALILIGPLRGMLKKSSSKGESEAPNAIVSPITPSADALNALLDACVQSEDFRSVSRDELGFFDGTIRLAVQNLDTQELYLSQPLTASQQASAQKSLSVKGQPHWDASAESDYAVWIMLGNGQVATPCLTPSAGNIGAAVLFRYEAEQIPTQEFFRLLENLTS